MTSDLPAIKVLFSKLYKAHLWALAYPQETNPDKWRTELLPVLDSYYTALESLGVDRTFSMCLFCFGIPYLEAYRGWTTEAHRPTPPDGSYVIS
jgi:hypothetical protein